MRTIINEGLSEFARFSVKTRVEAIIEIAACDWSPASVIKSRLASLMDWAEKIEKETCEDMMAAELN